MKHCFVIMPIKQSGSGEYTHFRALFDNVISPTIGAFGYQVKRADDFQKSGSITKDIILPLATADLVVADLTDLNANVFYELGVRHALRGSGTIMILDEKETRIPFDLTNYRVIKFQSNLSGIGKLSTELKSFVTQFEAGTIDSRDNLVHDILPGLPVNVLATADGSEESKLRAELQGMRKKLQTYANRFGILETAITREDPQSVVRQALLEAQQGNLPSLLIQEAAKSAEAGNHNEFLATVSRLLDVKTSRPTPRALMNLMSAADSLDLTSVREAILDHASLLYPKRSEIMLIRLQTFAHSDDPIRRKTAREEFLRYLDITVTGSEVRFARPLNRAELVSFSVMLDAYQSDELFDEALDLVEHANREFPNKSILQRNLGRAYEKRGDNARCLELYISAANAPDADDTASVWLGNELHNRGKHVDASEAYTQACLRDPDDAKNFSHLADDLAFAIAEAESGITTAHRELPAELRDKTYVVRAVRSGLACGQLKSETLERLRAACSRVELDLEGIASELHGEPKLGTRSMRLGFAHDMKAVLASELTDQKVRPEGHNPLRTEPAVAADSSGKSSPPAR